MSSDQIKAEEVKEEGPVGKSRLIRLLKGMGLWPDGTDKEEVSETEEEPEAAPLRLVPVPPPQPPPPEVIRVPVRVPVAVPVPVPMEQGVDPLDKLSFVLPSFFRSHYKQANTVDPNTGAYRGAPIDMGAGGPASPDLSGMGEEPMGAQVGAGPDTTMNQEAGGAIDTALTDPISTGAAPKKMAPPPQAPSSGGQSEVNASAIPRDSFERMLMQKFAQDTYAPYYATGLAPGASMMVAGLGGYGGAQVGRSLAGIGTEGAASRQLANVERQLMEIANNPHLSGGEKRRMLKALNREAALFGVGPRATMPGSPGQAEAMFKRMSGDLGGQLKTRRVPAMRGLGMVAGAAAPFIIPDFLRNMGVV